MIYCAYPLAQFQSHREEILEAIRCVLDGGNYVLGPEVEKFEREFAAYCGASHGVGVNSGTDALILTLKALNIGPGDEVITVSHTALATVSAIVACGATPVLVDVDPVYYTMDPECVRLAVTPKTRAVIPVHLYGQCADMDAIIGIAREFGLAVIEDCAQATGAVYRGRHIGSFGDAACFSFYPTKNLGGIGDGGMVVTSNRAIEQRVRRLRQYGWSENRQTVEPGHNSRLDEIQAAILNVKLKYLDDSNKKRKRLAQFYEKELADCGYGFPFVRADTVHVYHLYVIKCAYRDLLMNKLAEAGIAVGIHYRVPAHQHGGYDKICRLPMNGLPVTGKLVQQIVSLPIYPELSIENAEETISALKQASRLLQ